MILSPAALTLVTTSCRCCFPFSYMLYFSSLMLDHRYRYQVEPCSGNLEHAAYQETLAVHAAFNRFNRFPMSFAIF